jgi:hypothetical protein
VEGELGLNYKEKLFVHGIKKSKFNEWFSNRTPLFMPSAFVGLNTKSGLNFKFKYYLDNFLKTSYVDDKGVQIYKDIKSAIFYFSLSLNVRQGAYKAKTYNRGA